MNENDKTEILEPVETPAENITEPSKDGRKCPKWLLPLVAAVCAVILVVAGIIGWNAYSGAKLAEAKELEAKGDALYTTDSWNSFSATITGVEYLLETGFGTQEKVDTYLGYLTSNMDGLTYRAADYSAVDEALSKVPADLSGYTDESVAALRSVIDAVDRTKNITEQAAVDKMARDILSAVAGLEKTGALDWNNLADGVYNFIHNGFERGLEIAVLLFAGQEPQTVGQILQPLLNVYILNVPGLHLLNHFTERRLSICIELISALCLLLIELRQILPEDLFCQPRLDLRNALFGQKPFGRICTETDHVDMGVVRLIVKGGIPSEVLPGYLHRLGHIHGVLGEQRFPFIRLVITESGGILPAQGNDRQPYIAGVSRNRFRYLRQHKAVFCAGEQSVEANALCARTSCNVVQVVIHFCNAVIVVLQRTGDKF